MRRLILGFAGRTYHIVGNLMLRLIYACTHPKPKIYGYGRNVHLRHFSRPKCPWPKCPGRNVLGRNVRGRNVRAPFLGAGGNTNILEHRVRPGFPELTVRQCKIYKSILNNTEKNTTPKYPG